MRLLPQKHKCFRGPRGFLYLNISATAEIYHSAQAEYNENSIKIRDRCVDFYTLDARER